MDKPELIYILESKISETGKYLDSFAGEKGSMINRVYSEGERDAYMDILNIIIKADKPNSNNLVERLLSMTGKEIKAENDLLINKAIKEMYGHGL